MAETKKPTTAVVPSKKGTHEVSTPNKKLTPIEVLRGNMEGEFYKTVMHYYRGNEQDALMFKTAAVDYVRRVPKLMECDRISLLSAFAQIAQFRFMPSGVSGEAYIIPYGREAKFQLGYQGIVSLLYRTDKIKWIGAKIIYKNDTFDYEEGMNPKLIHKPAMFGVEKGEPIGVYTVVRFSTGETTFNVMDKSAVMAIKELSKAKGSKESPWNSDKDPEMWMWKKTCLIQHAKLLPKTQELQKAIEEDYKGEGMDKGNLDAGGLGVGVADHRPNFIEGEVIEPEGDPGQMTPEEEAEYNAQQNEK